MHSNERLKDTKKSWTLSEDGLTYTSKEMATKGSYYTEVEDMWGNKTQVKIEITKKKRYYTVVSNMMQILCHL